MELDIYYDDIDLSKANRAALLMAKSRYDDLLAPFVKNSSDRLRYIDPELDRIASECAESTGGDAEWVSKHLREIVAEVVLPITEPEKQDVTEGEGESAPSGGESQEKELWGEETSVRDHSPVLDDSDYGKRIEVQGCFRCGTKLASEQVVCDSCTVELREAASWTVPFEGEPGYAAPANPDPNQLYECQACHAFRGSQEQVIEHTRTCPEVQRQLQTGQPAAPTAATKRRVREVEMVPGGNTPANRFDRIIQQLANRSAAKKYSVASEDVIEAVASYYGLDPSEIEDSIKVVAEFGPYTAVDGEFVEEDADGVFGLDNFHQVNIPEMTGRMSAFEAVVPVDLAVRRVANDLDIQEADVYDSIREHYGADLDDQYHASVDGEVRFYLPEGMVSTSSAPKFTVRDVREAKRKLSQLSQRKAGYLL